METQNEKNRNGRLAATCETKNVINADEAVKVDGTVPIKKLKESRHPSQEGS